MIETTLEHIAELCSGTLADSSAGQTKVRGVCTDSRSVLPGGLFVPLAGERFDGHAYVEASLRAGAAGALWQVDRTLPGASGPLILVDDTYAALQRLAAAYLAEGQVEVVAVTGSNGKTTTKDLVASVLSQRYRVHKTEGNFNNHIGLPLTVLSMPPETEIAVLEMGMSGRGEIELLSKLARPDVAVVTNIGDAHLLQLGSREEIARAKLEITAGLRVGGLFVCHGDEPLVDLALTEREPGERIRLLRFGLGERCDLRPTRMSGDGSGMAFAVPSAGGQGESVFHIPLLGRHNVMNAMAALAVGRRFGLTDEQIAAGLVGARISGMRFERHVTPEGWVVLNDAYNASPTSMRAALSVLADMKGGRRIAVLADMLELGPQEATLHFEIGAELTPDKVDMVLTFGELGRHIAAGARRSLPAEAVRSFQDKMTLKAYLKQEARPGDSVLVKASRGMKLEEVVNDWIRNTDSSVGLREV
ncbi:UDP-N-acetylmuramoyl-tripeptide--D-alanyl-D-alanine ligase [Paenibacillus popilliae]|uniref:UDP-N-acetylmuramoyl-tripeptide--D-alanyl-D-alanine ligase n=1 Tax=Paenibacillus popilliae ATCC 14706 TaxID=1212764 RepID=M9M634_PAEPP|nr:UDP-N-acetylmuramoyl-tripeptide--D-alanyl-D-alanine ligase [Paenibacillus popilliae]GAC42918.1 UDP-N-acetylmuramyl pentapeptide synthase [Paenibacillus popilliae ATCC 14706]